MDELIAAVRAAEADVVAAIEAVRAAFSTVEATEAIYRRARNAYLVARLTLSASPRSAPLRIAMINAKSKVAEEGEKANAALEAFRERVERVHAAKEVLREAEKQLGDAAVLSAPGASGAAGGRRRKSKRSKRSHRKTKRRH
jgi:adenine C2-methylase RlmN of 23S rRNA A2503 and tRNA A37